MTASKSGNGEIEGQAIIPFELWRGALLVCTQSFLFGYVFSCLNACLMTGDNNSGPDCYHNTDSSCPPGTIYNSFNLSDTEAQLATALTVLGAWIGSLLGSKPAEIYGRRTTLLWNNILFIVGAVLSASGNFALLFTGRLISGFGVGIASSIPAVLLSEIASESTKGTITTLHQVSITIAIFVAALVGYGFVTYVSNGWQYVLVSIIYRKICYSCCNGSFYVYLSLFDQGLGCAPCFVFLAFYSYVPESPKWLLSKNRVDEAFKFLRSVRSSESTEEDIKSELDAMIAMDNHSSGDSSSENEASWGELFAYKKSVIIGCGLMVFQTLTGINAIIFYSTKIFGFAGFSQAIIGTTLVGFVNFCATVFSAYFIDKMGRKVLLSVGTSIMLISLVILSAVLLAGNGSAAGVVAVVMILIYIIGFAIGLGAGKYHYHHYYYDL